MTRCGFVIYGRSPYMCDIVIARNAVCDEAIHNKVNSLKTLDCFVVKNTPRNDEERGRHCGERWVRDEEWACDCEERSL